MLLHWSIYLGQKLFRGDLSWVIQINFPCWTHQPLPTLFDPRKEFFISGLAFLIWSFMDDLRHLPARQLIALDLVPSMGQWMAGAWD